MKKETAIDILHRIESHLSILNFGERLRKVEQDIQQIRDGNQQNSIRRELEAMKRYLKVDYVEEVIMKRR